MTSKKRFRKTFLKPKIFFCLAEDPVEEDDEEEGHSSGNESGSEGSEEEDGPIPTPKLQRAPSFICQVTYLQSPPQSNKRFLILKCVGMPAQCGPKPEGQLNDQVAETQL